MGEVPPTDQDKWQRLENPPDPTVAQVEENAVAIMSVSGKTVILGNEGKEEWLQSDKMSPLDLEKYR